MIPSLPTILIPPRVADHITWVKENIPDEIKEHSLAIAIGLGTVGVVGTYAYLSSKLNKWKKLGIPGPEPTIFFGNSLDKFFRNVPEVEQERYEKYGKVYGTYEYSTPILVLGEPEWAKNILVRDFNSFMSRPSFQSQRQTRTQGLARLDGEKWRKTRNTITPSFTSGKMKLMMSVMEECGDVLCQVMEKCATSGHDADIKIVYGCYTMEVMARCGFATETNAQLEGDKSLFVQHALNYISVFNQPPRWKAILGLFLPQSLIPSVVKSESVEFLVRTVRKILAERKKLGFAGQYRDFVQILLDSAKDNVFKDEDNRLDDAEAHHVNEHLEVKNGHSNGHVGEKKGPLSEEEIVVNAIGFLVAGYETTATLLTYCTYLLAMNPEKQEILRRKCQEAFEAAGQKIDYETVSTLKYLDSVICESLRLYQPALGTSRILNDDHYKIETSDGKVINLKKGDIIKIPTYAMHHCEEFYPDPEKFEPERFLPENRDKLVPYTYLPFGAGPRNCIGMRFALLEAKVAIMKLILKYRFVRTARTPAKPDMSQAMGLLGSKDLYVKVDRI